MWLKWKLMRSWKKMRIDLDQQNDKIFCKLGYISDDIISGKCLC